MSSSVSLRGVVTDMEAASFLAGLLGDAVGPGDHLERVEGHTAGLLDDGAVGQVAVAGHDLGVGLLDLGAQLLGVGQDSATFSARKPHMPSTPEHSWTSVILAPVSFIRSRLFRPMFWARRWQGVW